MWMTLSQKLKKKTFSSCAGDWYELYSALLQKKVEVTFGFGVNDGLVISVMCND